MKTFGKIAQGRCQAEVVKKRRRELVRESSQLDFDLIEQWVTFKMRLRRDFLREILSAM